MNSRKKLVFFGDVNNVLLTVAFGLHSRGYDVQYLPSLKIDQHFRVFDIFPNCDAEINKKLKEFLLFEDFGIALSRSAITELGSKLKELKSEGYMIFGSNYAPLVAEFSGVKLDAFVVTGSDLITAPRKPAFIRRILENYRKFFRTDEYLSAMDISELQQRGIERAKNILTHSEGYFKLAITELSNLPRLILPYPIPVEDTLKKKQEQCPEEVLVSEIIKKLRRKTKYIAIMLSKIDPIKGSNVFIDGFYDFTKEIDSSAILIIPKRGRYKLVLQQNPRMRALINSGNIVFIPPISQASIYCAFQDADVAFGINYGEYTLHDWNTTLMQSLQATCPLITYQPFESLCNTGNIESYPHFNAKDRGSVREGLKYFANENNRREEQKKISKWNTYMRVEAIDLWSSIIESIN